MKNTLIIVFVIFITWTAKIVAEDKPYIDIYEKELFEIEAGKTSKAQEEVEIKDTVTISGEIIFDEYTNGPIIIMARTERFQSTSPDISYTKILKPGPYTFKVPKNTGNIYIEAMNIQEGQDPTPLTPRGVYEKNPIKIDFQNNIEGVDMKLAKELSILMETYNGPTVTITGEIIFNDYESGPIIIMARTPLSKGGMPDIAYTELSGPGRYVLKVPENFGYLYIEAVNPKTREGSIRFVPFAKYPENPIEVGSLNIEDVDIVLSQK